MKKLSKLAQAIKIWEKSHKSYIESNGMLNSSGFDLCHECEVEWGNDPKWNDHELYHLRPRLESYWSSDPYNSEDNDGEYKLAFKEIHPRIAKELWD